jgi:hypothetical protein
MDSMNKGVLEMVVNREERETMEGQDYVVGTAKDRRTPTVSSTGYLGNENEIQAMKMKLSRQRKKKKKFRTARVHYSDSNQLASSST